MVRSSKLTYSEAEVLAARKPTKRESFAAWARRRGWRRFDAACWKHKALDLTVYQGVDDMWSSGDVLDGQTTARAAMLAAERAARRQR